ncbi:MAG: hypothetical protein J0I13_16430 [Rhizobiales bacterium]|nr:hypothetical protein [Hyphomicrobiales bacterium]
MLSARHRHHVERRLVVLGEVQAIETGFVCGLDERQPLVEKLRQRPPAVFDMIEQPDFHNVTLAPVGKGVPAAGGQCACLAPGTQPTKR